MQAQIYIVRIYRENGAPGFAGVVEIVQCRKSESFRNFEELRTILDKPRRGSRLKVKGPRRGELRVTGLAPGATATPLTDKTLQEDAMKVHYAIYLTAGFALSALVSPAHAGKSISWEGVQYYAGGQIQAVQMEEGHSIILARWEGIHASKDTTSPVHLIRLECAGSIDARRDGTFEANGYCLHTDRDGDKWVGRWWNNNKMPVAKFEVFHGSGKYAGATGGGTAKCTPLKPGTIDTMVCEQTGTLELK